MSWERRGWGAGRACNFAPRRAGPARPVSIVRLSSGAVRGSTEREYRFSAAAFVQPPGTSVVVAAPAGHLPHTRHSHAAATAFRADWKRRDNRDDGCAEAGKQGGVVDVV